MNAERGHANIHGNIDHAISWEILGDPSRLPAHATSDDLKDDGTTTAGDWIYTGSYTEQGHLSKRGGGVQDVKKNDPTGLGYFHNWVWSWPLNQRVLYNRASADSSGRPWNPQRPGIQWEGIQWVGDVPELIRPHRQVALRRPSSPESTRAPTVSASSARQCRHVLLRGHLRKRGHRPDALQRSVQHSRELVSSIDSDLAAGCIRFGRQLVEYLEELSRLAFE